VLIVVGIAGGALFGKGTRSRSQTTPTATATPAEEGTETPPEAEPRQVKSYPAEPAMTIDTSKQYFAVIKTDKGDIRLQLFADQAPRAVNNFVFLAKDGFYDGLTFYRVLPGFVAQAGDPTCTDSAEVTCTTSGGPGYSLPRDSNDLKHEAGVVAMAAPQGGEDTNGSQFYITYTAQSHLDGRDTVFGKVVEGMDVAESLTSRDARDPTAPPGDKIVSVSIEELGGAPSPTTE